jgi:hypothetical protein
MQVATIHLFKTGETMKHFRFSTSIKWFALLVILGMLILWATFRSQAQDLEQGDVNAIFPGIVSAPGSPFVYPSGEANSPPSGHVLPGSTSGRPGANLPGEMNSAKPDLVITDPNADVQEQITRLNGLPPGSSLVVPAADFTADSNGRTWFFGFNSAYIYPNSASGYCGIAPLYLPQGATITAFTAYVYDNDASYGVSVSLYPKQLGSTTIATASADVSSSIQSTNLQALVDTTISPAIIDNVNYTYHVGVCMWGADNNSRFYAVQVNYTR